MQLLYQLIDDGGKIIFFGLFLLFLRSAKDHLKRNRSQYHSRSYRKYGIIWGGVVTDRKYIGNRLFVRYAYRLPNYSNKAYVKDFVEAPKELEAHHKNIVVILFPRHSMSGIHYGILQKLNATNKVGIAFNGFVGFCSFCLGFLMWPDIDPSAPFYWPYYILLYFLLFQTWREEKRTDEATGVTRGVRKTWKRQGVKRRRLQSLRWDPLRSDDTERKLTEDIFVALDRAEHDFVQIMKSFNPSSSVSSKTFPCEKYFSFASVCQEALQNASAPMNA
mmetsp:Transcript_30974/g.74499  ORF Transcript_30974/g.74499 Transcript_30974/m.74499 type:complete len:276 (+) Transcript_30974:1639-2466(+)